MSFISLLIVAAGASFGTIYLLSYIPLATKSVKKVWSPRLVICKLLAPADVGVTLAATFLPMVGLTSAVMGISLMVYNVLVGIGFSGGVIITKKFFLPRWEKQYLVEKRNLERA